MAVLARIKMTNAQRYDLSDALSIDGYSAGDWLYFIKMMAGSEPYILKGFDVISPELAIGTDIVSIRVEDSYLYYPNSDTASFFYGLPISSGLSDPIEPVLKKNAINYLYLTISLDEGSPETKSFWDIYLNGSTGGEYDSRVNTETYVIPEIGVSTINFPTGTIPICKVTVGSSVISSIEDCRPMFFRLGTGGYNADPFNRYNFRSLPSATYERLEPSSTISSVSGDNPFQGADKNIYSWKEWCDVVMTKLAELGGTNFWYEYAPGSISGLSLDLLKTEYKSKGYYKLDDTIQGLLTWSEDIRISPLTYVGGCDVIIRENTIGTALNNEQICYIDLDRGKPVNTSNLDLVWRNGLDTVDATFIGAFANTNVGDYIKKSGDPDSNFVRIVQYYASTGGLGATTTPANAMSVKCDTVYLGTDATAPGIRNKGIFENADIITADRGSSAFDLLYGDFCWVGYRSDTIESIDSIVVTSRLGAVVTVLDPTTISIYDAAHGLSDGDKIYIDTAPYTGLYTIAIIDTDNFTVKCAISGGATLDYTWALVKTAARVNIINPLLQEESANNCFEDNGYVYFTDSDGNGYLDSNSHVIKRRNDTEFTIGVPTGTAYTPTPGTNANTYEVNMYVRLQGKSTKLIQGEIIYIDEPETEALRTFVGQANEGDDSPKYNDFGGPNIVADGDSLRLATTKLDKEVLESRFRTVPSTIADKTVHIYPSKRVSAGKTVYTYIIPNISSKFPRTAYSSGDYDGGINNDRLVNVTFDDSVPGTISVSATGPTFPIQNIATFTPITPSRFYAVSLFVNQDDTISAAIGTEQVSYINAINDDNIPLGGSSQLKVCTVVLEIDGAGLIQPITSSYILDRRAFGGGGGGGDIDREDMIYISQLQDSIFTKAFYNKFNSPDIYTNTSNTTAVKQITIGPDYFADINYSGVIGSVYETLDIDMTGFTSFYLHLEKDPALVITCEYDDGVIGWTVFNPFEVISTLPLSATTKFRFTWTGVGNLYSFGIFYDMSYVNVGATSNTRLFETYLDTTGHAPGWTFALGSVYTNDGKSLEVYKNGSLLTIGIDYLEIDSTHIQFINAVAMGASLSFKENFGPYSDFSGSMAIIIALQTSVANLNTKTDDLYVGSTVGSGWYIDIPTALAAITTNKKIIVTEDQTVAAQLDLSKAFPYTIEFKQGVKISCANALATSVIKINSELKTINMKLELTHAAGNTIAGYEIDGDFSHHTNLSVIQTGTGTLDTGILLNAGSDGNYLEGYVYQQAGTITSVSTDNSGTLTNDLSVRGVI